MPLLLSPRIVCLVVTDNSVLIESAGHVHGYVLVLVVVGKRWHHVHGEGLSYWSLALDVDNLAHLKIRKGLYTTSRVT